MRMRRFGDAELFRQQCDHGLIGLAAFWRGRDRQLQGIAMPAQDRVARGLGRYLEG